MKGFTFVVLCGFSSLPAAHAGAPALPLVTLGDYQYYTQKSYSAFAAPFHAGSLIRGKDYVDTIVVHPSTFPNETSIAWTWPSDPCPVGIYNFISIQFGNYYNTPPDVPIPSKKVNEITTLTERHDLTIGGSLQGFDVITDLFLTSAAGGSAVHAFEIEVFLHTPKYGLRYVNRSSAIGTYQDTEGMEWRAVIDTKAKDILFMPRNQAAVLAATIDLRAMLNWLVSEGTITGGEYFNGLGIGVEVRQDKGSLAIKSFSMTYD